jgi:hypothetical protein
MWASIRCSPWLSELAHLFSINSDSCAPVERNLSSLATVLQRFLTAYALKKPMCIASVAKLSAPRRAMPTRSTKTAAKWSARLIPERFPHANPPQPLLVFSCFCIYAIVSRNRESESELKYPKTIYTLGCRFHLCRGTSALSGAAASLRVAAAVLVRRPARDRSRSRDCGSETG